MEREDITFYLALWGATTSTLLFIFAILKFRKEISGKLKVIATQSTENEIIIKIANISFRPLTLISFDILYGANEDYYQIIKTFEFDHPIKINETETYSIQIPRLDLSRAVIENKIEQKYYHELKIRILTSSSGVFFFNIPISESIIKSQYYQPAGKYIAADIYLGFPQKEAFYYPVGGKILSK